MEIDPRQDTRPAGNNRSPGTFRLVNFAVVAITLMVFIIILGMFVAVATNAAAGADKETRRFLVHMAWVAVVLLSLAAIVLIWLCLRRIKEHFFDRPNRPHDEYVDAWSLAGRRFELDDEDDSEDTEEE